MSEHIVNALTGMKKVYLEQVSHMNLERMYLEEETRQIEEFKKPKLDPVGKEDGDIDNDGDNSDAYLKNRRNVVTGEIEKEILAAMKKLKSGNTSNSNESANNVERNLMAIKGIKPQVKESAYYNWRDTVDESLLWEIIDDVDQKQVKEKNVNNYVGKNPVVEINPEIKTESILIDTEELDENFIQESIDIVTDDLFEEGLTYEDIEDLITELGVEEFYEWVVEFGYETLCEEAVQGELLTTKGQARKNPKITKQPGTTSVIRHTPSKAPSNDKEKIKTSPGQLSLNPNIENQERIKTFKSDINDIRNLVARGVLSGWEGHKKAMATRKKGGGFGQQLLKGLGAATSSFTKKGTSQFREWVEELLDEGYDLSEYTWDELYEEYEDLYEKAVSEQQQKLFGLALSVKRGETSRSEVSEEVLKIVDTVSEKEIRKYAGTSHEGIPKKK
jgi:hypothetical protein